MSVKKSKVLPFSIGEDEVNPGERKIVDVRVASMYDYTELSLSVQVVHGEKPGPVLFICAAIHGDEINGVEIIRRLIKKRVLNEVRGTLLLIPVVNIFGFNNKSRYFPDRRDLNRVFPGSKTGSLASQFAHVFMKEIVSKSSYGIDLHTGGLHRDNLPQVRASLDDRKTAELARSFGVPVIVNSSLRDGSLREAARKKGVTTLVFEGGEALRHSDETIRIGVQGCLNVMQKIGMIGTHLPLSSFGKRASVSEVSYWLRAPHGGSFRSRRKIGDLIKSGDLLAVITDPFGRYPFEVVADADGLIIGMSTLPLVHKGDAMFHVAVFNDPKKVQSALSDLREFLGPAGQGS